MLAINWSDVVSLLNQNLPYFIAIGGILVVGILIVILCRKLPKHTKYLVRSQTAVAMVLSIAIVLNLFCTGPMYTLEVIMLPVSLGMYFVTLRRIRRAEAAAAATTLQSKEGN